jgi:CDP-glucose 4,6-dehydratase
MKKEFWKGKRVLITGHTGFKGSWLSLWLQSVGSDVLGYALQPPTQPSLFEIAHIGSGMESIVGDVRNFDFLKSVIVENEPEIIFHMAAQSVVKYSYDNPIETYSTNVMGTVNLLEAVRKLGGRRSVIIVTSDKCYENNEWVWGYRENDALGGRDPYSNSKACAELVTSAFRSSFFQADNFPRHSISVASVRAGNVIGGGDWTNNQLVPDVMTAFMGRRPVLIRSPSAIRPWQFVLEPLDGYISLAELLWTSGAEFAEGWNFGPEDDDAKPVSWIVENLSKLWDEGACWEVDRSIHPPEAKSLKLDSSRAKDYLAWSPKLRLSQALEWVVEWYKAYHKGEDVQKITKSQISKYEDLI